MSTSAQTKAATSGSNKGLMIVMAICVLASAGSAAFMYLQSRKPAAEDAPVETPTTSYVKFDPTIVVNLADAGITRYIQADVELVIRDPKTAEAAQIHAPALRNRLVLLLGQQTSMNLATREAKEALQKAALAELKSVLTTERAPAKIDGVIFTNLVTQ